MPHSTPLWHFLRLLRPDTVNLPAAMLFAGFIIPILRDKVNETCFSIQGCLSCILTVHYRHSSCSSVISRETKWQKEIASLPAPIAYITQSLDAILYSFSGKKSGPISGCTFIIWNIQLQTYGSNKHYEGLFYGIRTIFSFQFFYPL